MNETQPDKVYDRMLFFGSAALADGFALIGFETWVDPEIAQMNHQLELINQSRGNAFVLISSELAAQESRILDEIKKESGRILVMEIPSLDDPDGFSVDTDAQVMGMLGNIKIDAESV